MPDGCLNNGIVDIDLKRGFLGALEISQHIKFLSLTLFCSFLISLLGIFQDAVSTKRAYSTLPAFSEMSVVLEITFLQALNHSLILKTSKFFICSFFFSDSFVYEKTKQSAY